MAPILEQVCKIKPGIWVIGGLYVYIGLYFKP